MLSQEANEHLTRVGAGTPRGNLMWQHCMPMLLASELQPGDAGQTRQANALRAT